LPASSEEEEGPDQPAARARGAPDGPTVLSVAGHSATVDAGLAEALEPHQLEGVNWLYGAVHGAHADGWHGGLLADGMGFGKTLQALALVHTLASNGEAASSLVVVPHSLLDNWEAEATKWLGASGVPSGARSLRIVCLGANAQAATVSRYTITHAP